MELELGSEFAGHRLEAVAGRGGMGVVYRARNLITEQQRALKVIAPGLSADVRFRERFKRESRLAARLEHPNVIPLHDAREEDGLLYLVMRYVEGTDLATLLKREGRLRPARALAVVSQVATALDAAHDQGLVHRDVKPANVLIEQREGREHAYLTDFGLVKDVSSDSALTSTGVFMGTYHYAAPEQLDPSGGKAIDRRADIYALGCVLYHTLAGEVPFPRDSLQQLLIAHLMAEPPDVCEASPDLPAELAVVIQRAMSKDPDDRFQTAGGLADAARAALSATTEAPRPPAPTPADAQRPVEADTRREATGEQHARQPTHQAPAPTQRASGAGDGAQDWGDHSAADRGRQGAQLTGRGAAPATSEPRPQGPAPPTEGAPTPRRPRPTRTRRRRRVLVAAAGLVAVVAAAPLGAILLRGGEPTVGEPTVGDPIPVGTYPAGVAVGDGAVWVANAGDGTVSRIDPDSGETVGDPIPVGSRPAGVAVGAGAVWVANLGDGTVSRIDPDSGETVGDPIRVGGREGTIGVAVGAGAVWVTNQDAGTVSRIDPDSGKTVGEPIRVGLYGAAGVAVGDGAVWVTSQGDGTVSRIDPDSGKTVGDPIPVGGDAEAVAVGDGAVWVTSALDGTVSRIDPGSGERVGEATSVGADPAGVAVGEGAVWVTAQAEDTVSRIDPDSGETVGDPVPVGSRPAGVAVGAGAIWVANADDGTVSRIDP